MWVDLLKVGANREKLDGEPNKILLELWQQLKPEQQFRPLREKKKPAAKASPCVRAVSLQDYLAPNPALQGQQRLMIGPLVLTREKVEGPTSREKLWTGGLMLN